MECFNGKYRLSTKNTIYSAQRSIPDGERFSQLWPGSGCVSFFGIEHEVASMTGASPATTIPRGALRGIVVAGLAPVMQKNETHPPVQTPPGLVHVSACVVVSTLLE